MNQYVRISLSTFTIWIMASLINGLLCGIYLSLSGNESDSVFAMVFISIICSLFFSAPGFFVFWIIMLMSINKKLYGRSLFRAALSAAIILSGCTAFFTFNLLGFLKGPAISLFIILSAITSIMMHFNGFKKTGTVKSQDKNEYKIYNQNLTT